MFSHSILVPVPIPSRLLLFSHICYIYSCDIPVYACGIPSFDFFPCLDYMIFEWGFPFSGKQNNSPLRLFIFFKSKVEIVYNDYDYNSNMTLWKEIQGIETLSA